MPTPSIANPDGTGAVFHFRSAALTLVSIVSIYGVLLALLAWGPPTGWKTAGLLGLAVALQVVVLSVGHAVLALRTPPEPDDERDRRIALRAQRPAGWISSAGLLLALLFLTAQQIALESSGRGNFDGNWTHPMWVAHLLLFALVLSESMHLAAVVWGYRRS